MQLELFKIDERTTLIDLEEWRQCCEFPSIMISSHGRFRSNRTGRLIAGTLKEHGYRYIGIIKNGKVYTKLAHRLVAQTFLQGTPSQTYVNHKNKNRSDNRVSNLEWVTASENAKHSKRKS